MYLIVFIDLFIAVKTNDDNQILQRKLKLEAVSYHCLRNYVRSSRLSDCLYTISILPDHSV